MQSSIALTRTQIYITQQQQQRLQEVSRRTSISKSELIRQAVNRFLDQAAPAPQECQSEKFAGLAGLWAQRTDMSDPAAYLQAIRKPRF